MREGYARLTFGGKIMRTEKRFTRAVLERFEREGRGTGTFQDYIPWHRVSRSDPSSRGRSHLMIFRERQLELLSDGEWGGSHFVTMLPNLVDLTEQRKLSLHDEPHELAAYDVSYGGLTVPGTLSIARQLGIKHPLLPGDSLKSNWVMTTDQVLLLQQTKGGLELLAISYKSNRSTLSKRDLQKFSIEKAYWAARSADCLLITHDLYEDSVALTLRRVAPWGLGSLAKTEEIDIATEVVINTLGRSYTYTVRVLSEVFSDEELAKRAIWQAAWTGKLPINLRRGWRPHLPLELLSQAEFAALNPIASRRSAWT